jgi:hypothetical protein
MKNLRKQKDENIEKPPYHIWYHCSIFPWATRDGWFVAFKDEPLEIFYGPFKTRVDAALFAERRNYEKKSTSAENKTS